MKKCVRCKAVIGWEKDYCPMCGGAIALAAADRAPAAPPPAPKEEPAFTVSPPSPAPLLQVEAASPFATLESAAPRDEALAAEDLDGAFIKQEAVSFSPAAGGQEAGMFSKLGETPGAEQAVLSPAPPVKRSAAVTGGEFLSMFPDADPGESVLDK